MVFIAAGSCEPLRVWSRLEPRTRQVDFANALAARIADPMFLLARQWQFGEFRGEDTGSAVFATLARRVTGVDFPGAAVDDGLEPAVERLPLTFPLIVRARLGRTLLSHVDAAAAAAGTLSPAYDPDHYRRLFRAAFGPLDDEPTDPVGRGRDRAAPRARRVRQALREAAVDGLRVRHALSAPVVVADLPAPLASAVAPGHLDVVLRALEAYRQWFDRTYAQPDAAGDRWDGDQLEYGFTATAATDAGALTLAGEEHTAGRLDWYSFDQGSLQTGTRSAATTDLRTVIPDPAEFPGMPTPRWWQLEDSAVNLGRLRADSTDTARIVVAEFATLYGNNWFVVACRQPVGTVAELQGVIITDVFGWRTLVRPTSGSAGGNWTDWDAFSLSPRPGAPPAAPLPQHLYLPASLTHIQDGEPHEKVAFVRDETADMVWAVEQRVPDGLGRSREGADAARGLHQELAPADEGSTSAAPATLRWTVQTEVEENWIPFIPVHKPSSTREIRLQRAAMHRLVPPVGSRVRPVTSILRPGVAPDDSAAAPYFVNEEEVPRAGVVVAGVLRRARRFDGVPVVWHARTVRTGRGSGHSGLTFDVVTEVRS